MILLSLSGQPDEVVDVRTGDRTAPCCEAHDVVGLAAMQLQPGSVMQTAVIATRRPPAEPMHGLGDLARALGGDETSFTGRVLEQDLVWLPRPLRDRPDSVTPGLREQALALEEQITAEPGRVVSIDETGWAMVDCGSWGQFGHRVEDLRQADCGAMQTVMARTNG